MLVFSSPKFYGHVRRLWVPAPFKTDSNTFLQTSTLVHVRRKNWNLLFYETDLFLNHRKSQGIPDPNKLPSANSRLGTSEILAHSSMPQPF